MYCLKCGAEIAEGSAFCTSCGARVESAQAPQSGQPPYSQPPYGQPPYEQQSYGQYNQAPYGGQPPYCQPPKKGKLTWLFIVGGVVLALGVAAILLFVVFKVGGGGGGDDLLNSDTMQARFVNDSAKVFSNAFSGISGIDTERLMNEPFSVDMDFEVNASGFPLNMSLTASYDKQELGMMAEAMGQQVLLLLEDDTLYVSDPSGNVSGIRFDTDADLSKAMSLKERIKALTKGMSSSSGANYMLVIEAMVNSISEDCFKTGKDKTTLTLTPDDVMDMLNTLAVKADKDEDLSDALAEMDMDIDEALESLEDAPDFELTFTVGYDGGTPANLEINFDGGDEYSTFNLQFGYEETKSGKDITLSVKMYDQEIDASLTITKDGTEVTFDGEVNASMYGSMVTYTLEGTEVIDGDEVEGSFTVSDDTGSKYSIEYSGTVVFGMPEEMVADDDRFDVDTKGADIMDISEILSGGSPVAVAPDPTAPAVQSVAPMETYGGGSGVIAVILPSTDSSYYSTLVSDLTTEASYYGWDINVLTTNYAYMGEISALSTVLWGGYDGVIIDPFSMTAADIASLEETCKAAGIPCALLLDEGETPDNGAGAVWFDLVSAGADMALVCPVGNVFVIGNDAFGGTPFIEEGLFNDGTYGIADYPEIYLKGTQYAYDAASVKDAVNYALSADSIDTFICTDPDLSYLVLAELESRGFSGEMLCYTYETAMDETYSQAVNTYMTYEYFSISEIAYYGVRAIADQTEYGMSPQVYTLTSQSW